MDKSEALAVLHEIYDSCKESVSISCVSLDPEQVRHNGVGYQIRLKCDLDSFSRNCVEAVLAKHQLAMREEKGYVFVFKMH